MIHVDPASSEFEFLPKREQAKIYYFDIGWDEDAIVDELEVEARRLDRWLNEEIAIPRVMRSRVNARVRTAEDCEELYPEVCQLFRMGKSARGIIRKTGLSQSTVYAVLKCRFGPLRGRSSKRQ